MRGEFERVDEFFLEGSLRGGLEREPDFGSSYVALKILLPDDSESYSHGYESVETETISDSDGGLLFGGFFLE